jgi:hypothetical protein
MNTKPVWKSKLNILGVLTFIAGLGVYANMIPAKYAAVLLGVSGLCAAILRTFFTNTVTTVDGIPTTKPATTVKGE